MNDGRLRRTWARRWGPRTRDVTIIVLCVVDVVLQAGAWFATEPSNAALVIVPGIVATAAMWWRRRYPVTVFGIAALCYLVGEVVFPLGFALLTVAVRRRDRVLVLCTVATVACLLLPGVWATPFVFDFAAVVAAVLGALFWALLGAYVGARRDLLSSLQDRADRAEAERERRSEQARLAERARIAREMHDVLAHKVSLTALQAGGLEVNPGMGADNVQLTAGQIRTTAREALEDLRGVLGVLRADQSTGGADGMDLAPQPGIGDLESLVESSRAAGVRVSFAVDVPPLPDTLGRTVYRVVQEAMTNVHKHARGAATEIAVSAVGNDVRVRVTNRPPVAAGSLLPGSGAGLIGLRERVALVGGTLTAGPTADGGWQVDAVLPAAGTGPQGSAQQGTGDKGMTTDRGAAWLAS